MTLRVLGGEERFVEAERMLREPDIAARRRDLVDVGYTGESWRIGRAARPLGRGAASLPRRAGVRRRMDDRAGIVRALDWLANSATILGDLTSCAWAEEGEQLSRRLHDMETLSRHLIFKGRALCAMGRCHAAQSAAAPSLEIRRHWG
ncbi:MAG: hypothetical protein R2838_15955 [Caldilineaceae bacterium]